MIVRSLVLLLVLVSMPLTAEHRIEQATVERFIELYQQRSGFEQFMSLYTEDARLVDVGYGYDAKGKERIRSFFDWPNNPITPLTDDGVMSIDSLTHGDNKVILEGVFHRFEFQSKERGPWRFITILHFSPNGKIRYQEDWINYTPRSIMNGPFDFNLGERLQGEGSQ